MKVANIGFAADSDALKEEVGIDEGNAVLFREIRINCFGMELFFAAVHQQKWKNATVLQIRVGAGDAEPVVEPAVQLKIRNDPRVRGSQV